MLFLSILISANLIVYTFRQLTIFSFSNRLIDEASYLLTLNLHKTQIFANFQMNGMVYC